VKLLTTLVVISVAIILALGTATNLLAGGSATKENLLAQSGFRLKTVTSERQREQIERLPEGQVSAVTYQQKLYYVYRTMNKDQVYIGKQQQFDAYKQALNGAENTRRVQQEMQDKPDMVFETAGPNHVRINEFDGFGPMNPFGDE
jgi:type II secretory pathway pseudopilin PulG